MLRDGCSSCGGASGVRRVALVIPSYPTCCHPGAQPKDLILLVLEMDLGCGFRLGSVWLDRHRLRGAVRLQTIRLQTSGYAARETALLRGQTPLPVRPHGAIQKTKP